MLDFFNGGGFSAKMCLFFFSGLASCEKTIGHHGCVQTYASNLQNIYSDVHTCKWVAYFLLLMNSLSLHPVFKEPYIFPEIHDGNALQPTLDLLLSQKYYNTEMDKIYEKMAKKAKKAQYLEDIEAMIMNTRVMIDYFIESVQSYITTGAPHDSKSNTSLYSYLSCLQRIRIIWLILVSSCEETAMVYRVV